ncbi:Fic family protein [Geobacter benzoatilyticus]|uniref:Fic family protein n=1 Tax=Geobacter benzoatilyticus TaxID=2815309 RepID=A0ABX7PZJ1_9BACT|nr:Fic family protein [Geobacter benzoatilyticus]QSV44559.1 Fic family protein [Geobacter benzoatilyticus]
MTTKMTYEKTHPWINFHLNLQRIPSSVWVALGEAQSKCEHISGVPLRPATARELHQIYLAKGVLATTAIEGNTLSEEEALKRVKGDLKLPPSKEYLGQELDNIIDACNEIADRLFNGCDVAITVDEIKEFNKAVLRKLPLGDDVTPGEFRAHSVGVGSYRAAPAQDCRYLMDRYVQWLNETLVPFDSNIIAFNIIKSIVAHVYFAWIHPFADGNGRTARLIEFKILLCSGVPLPSAQLLTNHYNQTRHQYYLELDRASKSGGDLIPFIQYAVQGYVDGLREQVTTIRHQQFDVAWRNYVHEFFKDQNTPADVRRRHLVLDLSRKEGVIPLSEITEVSHRVSSAYVGKTKRTIERDINFLVNADLVVKTRRGVRAKTEEILAFLPARRIEESVST